jgi:hypothetical protein
MALDGVNSSEAVSAQKNRSKLSQNSISETVSRTAVPGRARGLALLRNSGMPEGPLCYFIFSFFFLSFLFFRVFLRFLRDTSSSFSTVSAQKKKQFGPICVSRAERSNPTNTDVKGR